MVEVSDILIAFLITSSIGCLLATIKRIYKFKISSINCCFNCIKIERDVNLEESIDNNRNVNSVTRSDTTTSKIMNLSNPINIL